MSNKNITHVSHSRNKITANQTDKNIIRISNSSKKITATQVDKNIVRISDSLKKMTVDHKDKKTVHISNSHKKTTIEASKRTFHMSDSQKKITTEINKHTVCMSDSHKKITVEDRPRRISTGKPMKDGLRPRGGERIQTMVKVKNPKKESIPPARQRLVFANAGKSLEDRRTIADLTIQMKSSIRMTTSLRGGF